MAVKTKFMIGSTWLKQGPTNIDNSNPDFGELKLTRGRSIIFPTVYNTLAGDVVNQKEVWTWSLVVEDSALYNQLKVISYSGQIAVFTVAYGQNKDVPLVYSGQILDLVFELHDKVSYNGNKKGYSVTMTVNALGETV
jgi:hypothetical protein